MRYVRDSQPSDAPLPAQLWVGAVMDTFENMGDIFVTLSTHPFFLACGVGLAIALTVLHFKES